MHVIMCSNAKLQNIREKAVHLPGKSGMYRGVSVGPAGLLFKFFI